MIRLELNVTDNIRNDIDSFLKSTLPKNLKIVYITIVN
jgi:hypothetical protein